MPERRAAEAVEQLTVALQAVSKQLDEVEKRAIATEERGKHTRWIAYVLAAAVVAGFISFLWLRVALIQQYQQDACEAANASRALENKLWTDLIVADTELSEKAGEKITAAERKAIEQIKANVAAAYPQRDCGEVKDGNVVDLTPTVAP